MRLVAASVAVLWSVAVAADIVVEGHGFEVGILEEGGRAYLNRTYVWQGVPETLSGWQFTRVNGGVPAAITVTAEEAGDVYLASAPKAGSLPGWLLVHGWRFRYNDRNRTVVRVFRRRFRAGESVRIPQVTWTGAMILAPHLTARIEEPTPDHNLVPGVVIDHSPARTLDYVGCPSIAILPNGDYVASHSFFGRGPRSGTRIFLSDDRGESWEEIAEVPRQGFSALFVHRGARYLMGTGGEGGQFVILRSGDRGQTWTQPLDASTGVLLPESGYHSAPVPVLKHGGRIWRAAEDRAAGGGWPRQFRAFMLSAPEDADLLLASSWTCSNRLASDDSWLDGEFEGWLEGNAVATPDGEIVNILRCHTYVGGTAAVIRVSADGATSAFDPETGFIDFPGGATKFSIRYDPVSRQYWSLTNPVDESTRNARGASLVRNTLALTSSPDLADWTVRRRVLHHPDPVKHGFQYVDWQFDGEDIVAVSRTAFDDGLGGAHNYHDANYFTFHRVVGFREGGDDAGDH